MKKNAKKKGTEEEEEEENQQKKKKIKSQKIDCEKLFRMIGVILISHKEKTK